MTDAVDPTLGTPRGRPGLLVLPGWDDDGKDQYDALAADLTPEAWQCRRADLPDARWPAPRRDAVNREDNLQQVLADFDALSSQAAPVAVLGFSYGGYMAALLATLRPVRWLVLRSPALYPDADWLTPKAALDKQVLEHYRHQHHTPANNRALHSCAAFRGDALLIESEDDEVIPGPVIDIFAQALGGAHSLTRYTLRGADHALSQQAWRSDYHARVVAWLTQQVSM